MKNVLNEPRLTNRDYIILIFVGEQECVRLDIIQKYLAMKNINVDLRSVRYSVDRLCELGFLRKDSIFARSLYVVSAKSRALEIASLPLKRGEKTLKPTFSTALHSIAVARVRIEYEINGAIWVCERKLREDFKQVSHLPDAFVRYQGNNFIIEVERTQKSNTRIQNIISTNASLPEVSEVHYWTPSSLSNFVQAQINALHPSIRNKVRILPLPTEVDR